MAQIKPVSSSILCQIVLYKIMEKEALTVKDNPCLHLDVNTSSTGRTLR